MQTGSVDVTARWGYPYRIKSHVVDEESDFILVTLKLIGYPSEKAHPSEWSFILKVPLEDLPEWPLGTTVRMDLI